MTWRNLFLILTTWKTSNFAKAILFLWWDCLAPLKIIFRTVDAWLHAFFPSQQIGVVSLTLLLLYSLVRMSAALGNGTPVARTSSAQPSHYTDSNPAYTFYCHLPGGVSHWQAAAHMRQASSPSARPHLTCSLSAKQSSTALQIKWRRSWGSVRRKRDKQKPFPLFNSPRGLHNPYSPSKSEAKITQLFSNALVHSVKRNDVVIVSFCSICNSVLNEEGARFFN
jgi:hypothetical protein